MRLLAALCLAFVALAHAQDYPSKSVRLIAAAAPGGNPDVLARISKLERVVEAARQIWRG